MLVDVCLIFNADLYHLQGVALRAQLLEQSDLMHHTAAEALGRFFNDVRSFTKSPTLNRMNDDEVATALHNNRSFHPSMSFMIDLDHLCSNWSSRYRC